MKENLIQNNQPLQGVYERKSQSNLYQFCSYLLIALCLEAIC